MGRPQTTYGRLPASCCRESSAMAGGNHRERCPAPHHTPPGAPGFPPPQRGSYLPLSSVVRTRSIGMNAPLSGGRQTPLPVDPAVAALPDELQTLLHVIVMAAHEAASTRDALQS